MRVRGTAFLVVLLVGCRSPAPDAKPNPSAAREGTAAAGPQGSGGVVTARGASAASASPMPASVPPDPSGRLVVGVDGRPMAHGRAFVKRLPDGKLSLYVGQKGSCNELLMNLFDDPAPHLLVELPAKLAPDGSERYTIGGLYFGPPTDANPGGVARVRGDASVGRKTEIELAFTGQGGRGEALDVKGKVHADGCGEPDTSKGPLPKATHPSTASMLIAKKRIAIRGALVRGESIELTDFPRDCQTAWFIGARLQRQSGSWRLDGARFTDASAGEAPALVVKRGNAGTGPDGPTVELELSGSDRIGEFGVGFSGKIQAIECR